MKFEELIESIKTKTSEFMDEAKKNGVVFTVSREELLDAITEEIVCNLDERILTFEFMRNFTKE